MVIRKMFFRNKEKQAEQPADKPVPVTTDGSLKERVIAAMRSVYDPEISVNIYDLGLIYEVEINQQAEVYVKMTLTAPACPVAGILPGQVEAAIKAVDGIRNAHVELVWDPPWSQERMSDEARLTLGMF